VGEETINSNWGELSIGKAKMKEEFFAHIVSREN
jgi:hypothetical protein